MVSQPDHHSSSPFSSSLTVRGSSSVVSRPAASSRSRRYNRSHTGTTSHIPQNEFPIFGHSGDVEIVIKAGGGYENRYLLHKYILTRCSGFFEASTSQEWSRALPETSSLASPAVSTDLARIAEDGTAELDGPKGRARAESSSVIAESRPRWRYELDRGAGDGDVPMLVQKTADPGEASTSLFGTPASSVAGSVARSKTSSQSSSSSSSHHNPSFFRSVANLSLMPTTATAVAPPLSQADQDLMRDYDNLFRIFYNYAPVLDGVNIADAYVQCKSLLCLADQYDALTVVGPRVDHHLLQFQSRLWKQIAKYPISYLRLGYLARSKVIFQEALIHVVGQWPVGERSLRAALPDAVLDIIEDKVDELEELVSRVEGRLFRLGLTTSRGERVTPATSYIDWLAISLFRQWLADNTTPSEAERRGLPDRGGDHRSTNGALQSASAMTPHLGAIGRAFRTLGSVNSAVYLGHDDCKRFLKLTPELYNRDNLRRFEKRIDELKSMARDIVRPLMGSGLELELGSGRPADGINYLTCTTVGNRDLPWPVEE